MEAHEQLDAGAVQAPPVPTMSYLAADAWANAGLAPTTGVLQTTGVGSTQYNVVDSQKQMMMIVNRYLQ